LYRAASALTLIQFSRGPSNAGFEVHATLEPAHLLTENSSK